MTRADMESARDAPIVTSDCWRAGLATSDRMTQFSVLMISIGMMINPKISQA